MIPETKLAAVKNALQTAFGVSAYEDIRKLTAGLSPDLIFRILVKGKPYLLRVITRTDTNYEPRHFACMKAGAEIGIAPRIRYMSIDDRILITDFIEAQPFPLDKARLLLADSLQRLHGLTPFPKTVNWLEFVDVYVRRIRDAKILPESVTGEIFQLYSRIMDVYPRAQDLVSCHNDLKPENIVFDGKKAWLVDWEAAFLNDRYLDLAVVGNFVLKNDRDEAEYLQTYFGEPAGEYRQARFFLMRQIAHMSYFSFIMMLASTGKPVDPDTVKMDFRDYHDRMWAGEITLVSDEEKIRYARVHMEEALLNMHSKRFEDSLKIVSNFHRS
jgi:hypothetical protein